VHTEISDLKDNYSSLSRAIHTANVSFTESKKVLEEIKPDFKLVNEYCYLFADVLNKIITLLLLFHINEFDRFGREHKKFIIKTIPSKSKKLYHTFGII
jgi:hypothetical protein